MAGPGCAPGPSQWSKNEGTSVSGFVESLPFPSYLPSKHPMRNHAIGTLFPRSTMHLLHRSLLAVAVLALAGCLASPVERSGGPGSVTIPDTNPSAIRAAAVRAFARYGYEPGPSGFPRWITFQRPAGRTGNAAFGGPFGDAAIRVRLDLAPVPGTRDIRVMPAVYRVTNASRSRFERETPMSRMWSGQFRSALQEIKRTSAGAGPR